MKKKPLNLDQPYFGTAEASAFIGVSKQRLTNWWKRGTSFPPPLIQLHMGPVWKREDIENWKRVHTAVDGELLPPRDGRSA